MLRFDRLKYFQESSSEPIHFFTSITLNYVQFCGRASGCYFINLLRELLKRMPRRFFTEAFKKQTL
jgi:hypothetical protein